MWLALVVLGRGQKSYAYTHSVQEGHHVYLNLESKKFYCLPDNYEIIDQSLEDIVVCLFDRHRASVSRPVVDLDVGVSQYNIRKCNKNWDIILGKKSTEALATIIMQSNIELFC